MFTKVGIFSIFICCCSAALVTTETDFKVLKALQGNWKIESEGKRLEIIRDDR
jgi:hypothetical protein